MDRSLAGILLIYTGTGIAPVFFVSAGTFAAMSLYGYSTRRDLSQFRSFLLIGVIGVVLASLVNLFFGSCLSVSALWRRLKLRPIASQEVKHG